MEHLTSDVGSMDNRCAEVILANLKELYDKGFISETMYYQNQCELFEDLVKLFKRK